MQDYLKHLGTTWNQFSKVFPRLVLFRTVSACCKEFRLILIEHQEAGMMGYLRIA